MLSPHRLVRVALTAFALVASAFAQTNTGPMNTPQINSTLYVGSLNGTSQFYPTIQKAVTAACGMGVGRTVDVPAAYTGTDAVGAVTGGCTATYIWDDRTATRACYTWGGSAYAAVSCGMGGGGGGATTPATSRLLAGAGSANNTRAADPADVSSLMTGAPLLGLSSTSTGISNGSYQASFYPGYDGANRGINALLQAGTLTDGSGVVHDQLDTFANDAYGYWPNGGLQIATNFPLPDLFGVSDLRQGHRLDTHVNYGLSPYSGQNEGAAELCALNRIIGSQFGATGGCLNVTFDDVVPGYTYGTTLVEGLGSGGWYGSFGLNVNVNSWSQGINNGVGINFINPSVGDKNVLAINATVKPGRTAGADESVRTTRFVTQQGDDYQNFVVTGGTGVTSLTLNPYGGSVLGVGHALVNTTRDVLRCTQTTQGPAPGGTFGGLPGSGGEYVALSNCTGGSALTTSIVATLATDIARVPSSENASTPATFTLTTPSPIAAGTLLSLTGPFYEAVAIQTVVSMSGTSEVVTGMVTTSHPAGSIVYAGGAAGRKLEQPAFSTATAQTFTVTSVAAASNGMTTYTGAFPPAAVNALNGREFIFAGAVVNPANNGAFTVTASSPTQITVTNPNGTAETLTAGTAFQNNRMYLFDVLGSTSPTTLVVSSQATGFLDGQRVSSGPDAIFHGAIVKDVRVPNPNNPGHYLLFPDGSHVILQDNETTWAAGDGVQQGSQVESAYSLYSWQLYATNPYSEAQVASHVFDGRVGSQAIQPYEEIDDAYLGCANGFWASCKSDADNANPNIPKFYAHTDGTRGGEWSSGRYYNNFLLGTLPGAIGCLMCTGPIAPGARNHQEFVFGQGDANNYIRYDRTPSVFWVQGPTYAAGQTVFYAPVQINYKALVNTTSTPGSDGTWAIDLSFSPRGGYASFTISGSQEFLSPVYMDGLVTLGSASNSTSVTLRSLGIISAVATQFDTLNVGAASQFGHTTIDGYGNAATYSVTSYSGITTPQIVVGLSQPLNTPNGLVAATNGRQDFREADNPNALTSIQEHGSSLNFIPVGTTINFISVAGTNADGSSAAAKPVTYNLIPTFPTAPAGDSSSPGYVPRGATSEYVDKAIAAIPAQTPYTPPALITGSVSVPATTLNACTDFPVTMTGTVTASTTYSSSFSADPGSATTNPPYFFFVDATHITARLCQTGIGTGVTSNTTTLYIAAR